MAKVAVLTGALLALGACTGVIDGTEAGPAGVAPVPGSSGAASWAPGMPEPSALVATPRVVRLSRLQWENAVRDLLRITDISAVTTNVTGDALVGLDNEAEALRLGPQLRADLERAALALAERVAGDAAALAQLSPSPVRDALISSLGARAFRRPLEPSELSQYGALFDQGTQLYPGDDPFVAGSKLLLAALLQSPYFLYRTELASAVVAGRVPLSDHEVASKLALALTAAPPDSSLLSEAAQGRLRTKAQVAAAAERLLDSAPGAASRDHLHFQAYRLGAYDGISRDPQVFPDFSPQTPPAMRLEVQRYLGHIFEQKLGVAAIFTTPVSFVNDTLAPLYGLPKTFGTELTRVDLNPNERAGLLTLPGFLSSYAVVNDPDTIHRGVFVNQRVLCRSLPPPDPNATVLAPLDPGMTNRERVEATTGPGTCGQGCHSTIINPPGFAYERFDAIGRYRSEDRGKPINSAASYDFVEGNKPFDGAVEFGALLAQSSEVHACYIQGWMSYLNGHPLHAAEQPLLDYLTHESLAGRLTLRDLVLRLVSADGFLNRLP